MEYPIVTYGNEVLRANAEDIDEVDDEIKDCLHLIRVTDHTKNHTMRIIMDDERGEAIAYFVPQNVYS